MTDAYDLFHELLFGEGAWFGFFLILGLCLFIAFSFKKSAVLIFPVTLLLAIEYLSNTLEWQALLMFITTAFMLLKLYNDLKGGK